MSTVSLFQQAASPGTPAAGQVNLWAGTDNKLKFTDSTGTVHIAAHRAEAESFTTLTATGQLTAGGTSGQLAQFGSGTRKLYLYADSGGVALTTAANEAGHGWYFDEANASIKSMISNALSPFTLSSAGLAMAAPIGIGLTPIAVQTGYNSLQVGHSGVGIVAAQSDIYLHQNANVIGGTWTYKANAGATVYEQTGGSHYWRTAPSGTSGNPITWDQNMSLTSSGLVLNTALDTTFTATGLAGHHVLRSGGVVRGYIGTDASNNMALIDSGATPRLAVSTGGIGVTGNVSWGAGTLMSSGGEPMYSSVGVLNTLFGVNGAEKGRFTGGGYFKVANSGVYYSAASSYHELNSNAAGNPAMVVNSSSASDPYGTTTLFTALAPNNASNHFEYWGDSSLVRAQMKSNGGLHNYSANNVNLSDERMKAVVEPIPNFWNEWGNINWKRYKFTDQTHMDWNYGYTAQNIFNVFSAKAPDIVGNFSTANGGRLGIYEADLHNIGMAVLTMAVKRINRLETALQNANIPLPAPT